jgi:hypothetical protein
LRVGSGSVLNQYLPVGFCPGLLFMIYLHRYEAEVESISSNYWKSSTLTPISNSSRVARPFDKRNLGEEDPITSLPLSLTR